MFPNKGLSGYPAQGLKVNPQQGASIIEIIRILGRKQLPVVSEAKEEITY